MSPKKILKKKSAAFKNIQSIIPKNLNLSKLKLKPTNIIENTKNKIENFYSNLKKQREKEKKRLENKKN